MNLRLAALGLAFSGGACVHASRQQEQDDHRANNRQHLRGLQQRLGSGTCGFGNRGDGICADGTCCSEFGWCGTSAEHCSGGDGSPPSTPSGTCGIGNCGDGVCADGTCCSEFGWCGTSTEHCSGGDGSPPNTPSGTCGLGNRGDGICADGSCCSEFGWCGTSAEHCSGGDGSPPSTPSGTCGFGNRGDGVCADGTCCSEFGWCGTSTEHCSGGDGSPPSTPSGTCGFGNRGDGICADGACCSEFGWCGTSAEHCSGGGGPAPGGGGSGCIEGGGAEGPIWPNNGKGLELEILNALDDTWQEAFSAAIGDWENGDPDVLTLTVTRGQVDSVCEQNVDGLMKVCNRDFGGTGWRGLNIYTFVGSQIVSSVAKMNDYYLRDDTSIGRQYTMCHEIGHGFGLPHTDESFDNPSLGDCMDYTNDKAANLHPGVFNYRRLASWYGTVGCRRGLGERSSSVKHGDQRTLSEDLELEYKEAVAEIEQLAVRRALREGTLDSLWELVDDHPMGSIYVRTLGEDYQIEVHMLHAFPQD